MKKSTLLPVLLVLSVVLAVWYGFKNSPGVGSKVAESLPAALEDSAGNSVPLESLRGNYIGLYFSAHWCPPCRMFTPLLVKFRDANVKNNFEVIFVSADRSESEKAEYIRGEKMKWPSVPGAHNREHQKLERQFAIPGYPTLIILDPDRRIVSRDGVDDIMISPETAMQKWRATARSQAESRSN